mgnify:CR=1 FL=1
MLYKVLICDNVDPLCKKVFDEREIETVTKTDLSQDELINEISEYDGIVVRSGTKVTKKVLEAASNLKVVGRAGVGVDNIDIDAATANGVIVMNTPDGNTISTAEHTCGMILALSRNIPVAVNKVKNGGWDRKKFQGTEVNGKTLGIVGLGKIGSEVTQRMQAFGMDVKAYDPYATEEKADELGVELMELDDLLGEVNYLTVHTPLTDKTKGLISRDNADKLKKGIRLINCARGGIIEEGDLPDLLDEGIVAGAALDVYTEEPPNDELYKILKHPKIVCTPHLGASTEEAQAKVAEQVARQMADAFENKSYKGSLNGKSIALSTNKEVQPYLTLAERLGAFVAQIAPEHANRFSFEYTGNCVPYSEVLTDAVLKGILTQQTDKAVNLVNARVFAKERGFKLQETTSSETRTFNDVIKIKLGEDAEYKEIWATNFGDDDYRIVQIDGFPIEIQLGGHILMYKNIDKPGMLASVSTDLAKQDINIASLSLGRNKEREEAVTAFLLDKGVETSEVEKIRDMEGITALRYIDI